MREPAVWPVVLEGEHDGSTVRLRGLRRYADRVEWLRLRKDNEAWNRPWDSTSPDGPGPQVSFNRTVREHDREARAGRLLPFALEVDGVLAGQLHLFGITRGALQGGAAGYWIDRHHAGRGIMPFALAMLIDHALGPVGLHRVEVNIRTENVASLRVVEKLGLREEGVRRAYLHIAGVWCDHRSFAITADELDGQTCVQRLAQRTGSSSGSGERST